MASKTKTESGLSVTRKKETRGLKKGAKPNNPTGKGLPQNMLGEITDEKREKISRLLFETFRTYKMERVKSDDELISRWDEYFKHCALTGERPTVEQMAQCTGYSISTVFDWETGRNKGFSSETSAIVKKAKDFLKVFDAKSVSDGTLNPVVYFFRSKNYYGMKDQQDIVVAPADPLGPSVDSAKLASDYLAALPENT